MEFRLRENGIQKTQNSYFKTNTIVQKKCQDSSEHGIIRAKKLKTAPLGPKGLTLMLFSFHLAHEMGKQKRSARYSILKHDFRR